MIKKLVISIPVLLILFFSFLILTTNPTITTYPSTSLSVEEKHEAETLFDKNKLSSVNLLPYKIDKDNLGKTHVRVYQIYQKVPVNEELILHFNSKTKLLESISGHPVPNISISTDETISNAYLVSKTMKAIGIDSSYYSSLARPINISVLPLLPAAVAASMAKLNSNFWRIKSPLVAKLSVYNKNSGTDEPQNWTMVWTMQPKEQDYPIFRMDANTGQTLYSFNGVIY